MLTVGVRLGPGSSVRLGVGVSVAVAVGLAVSVAVSVGLVVGENVSLGMIISCWVIVISSEGATVFPGAGWQAVTMNIKMSTE